MNPSRLSIKEIYLCFIKTFFRQKNLLLDEYVCNIISRNNIVFWIRSILNISFPQFSLYTSFYGRAINASWIFERKHFKNFVHLHIVHSYSIALATSTLSFLSLCVFYWSTSNIYCFFFFFFFNKLSTRVSVISPSLLSPSRLLTGEKGVSCLLISLF